MSKIENLTVGGTTYDITPDSLAVNDIRSQTGNPDNFTARELTPIFSMTGMPGNSWHSGFTVNGWDGAYNMWQMVGYSGDMSAHAKDSPLYFRNGDTATNSWYPWRTILDSKNYSDYALPKTYENYTASWGNGLYVFDSSYCGVNINSTGVKVVFDGAIPAETTYKVDGINRTTYGGSEVSYTYTFPDASGKLLVKNVGTVSIPNGTRGCAVFGLSTGADYTIQVHGSGDGTGYDDIYQLYLGDGPSHVCQHKIYCVASHLTNIVSGQTSWFHFWGGTAGSDTNLCWIGISCENMSPRGDSLTITVSTLNGETIDTSLDSHMYPEDYIQYGDFNYRDSISVVNLASLSPITNNAINQLFT